MKDDPNEAPAEQPATELIDSLCSTIQRQSATYAELVNRAVELEREECASLVEREAQVGDAALQRIAGMIRARGSEAAATRRMPLASGASGSRRNSMVS